jgi:hypothetical protein
MDVDDSWRILSLELPCCVEEYGFAIETDNFLYE